jgi:hypothetical protein
MSGYGVLLKWYRGKLKFSEKHLSLCHFDKFHMGYPGTEPIHSWLSPLNPLQNKLNFKYDEDD